MRKEILFAILAGVTFGLIIAFGVWRANVALRPDGANTTAPENTSETAQADFGITIAKPQDYQVITVSSTTLTGITKPNVWIIVSAEEEDYVAKTGENGEFEIEIDVIGGVNEILITAFDNEGAETQEKLILVYSSELAKQVEGDN
ncbi:hypothetical protein KKH23_01370 [Patescibacteria group bacterium]|nr:hypothetical protein [Patescibacteria group bacterium]MBU0777141.1 hypothetical protein [Patescibacteria group bacterium]MBU0845835.1 hypothetical protein [Patescibacteria group bacterium]MBU0922862.1 hypothetical protein [Patescibacteria group bacterium]MBU1066405.1 hypothetical protein [Patescibacteria group bacterium]